MKKFYFFLVALVLGVMSASAVDYYLVGGINSWNNGDANLKFTANSDGTYTLKLSRELPSDFKITNGTWADSGTYGSNGKDLVLGETYNLVQPGSNIQLKDKAVSNPTLVFNPTAKTLLITGEQAEVKVSYDIWGNMPAGSSTWAATTLTEADGTWSVTGVNVTAPSNFGIRELTNGAQTNWISAAGASDITAGGTFDCKVEGTNFSVKAGTYDISFNPTTMKLVVKADGGEPIPQDYDVYLAGEFNSWTGNDENYMFDEAGDGLYTLELGKLTGNFKVICNGSWLGTTTPVVSGETYTLSDIGFENMALAAAEAHDVVLTFDPANYTLVVTYDGSDEVDYTSWYVNVVGPFNDWKDNGVNPDADGVAVLEDLNIGTSVFKVKIWNGSADKWFAKETGSTIPVNTWTSLPNGDWSDGMAVADAVEGDIFKVTYNCALNQIYVEKTGTDGIINIEMNENAAPVYYNLQGVRVDAPANGLYIVVRGDKVAKEVVQ